MRNTLLLLWSVVCWQCSAMAQTPALPNGGFEQWTDQGNYDTPNDWTTLNVLAALGAPAGASQSSTAAAGNYALQLQTVSFFGNIIPGLAYLGDFNTLDPLNGTKFGKPFVGRPLSLRGSYRYTPVNGDVGGITIQLWRTNPATGKRDTIAEAELTADVLMNEYAAFELPLVYTSDELPDSINLVLITSSTADEGGGSVGSTLLVDGLELFYEPVGLSATYFTANSTAQLYPNPASRYLHIRCPLLLSATAHNTANWIVYDAMGRLIWQQQLSDSHSALDISLWAAGVYTSVVYYPWGLAERQRLVVGN